jgi:Raf kinase inhibitor-like YbhB/YbcL family protein
MGLNPAVKDRRVPLTRIRSQKSEVRIQNTEYRIQNRELRTDYSEYEHVTKLRLIVSPVRLIVAPVKMLACIFLVCFALGTSVFAGGGFHLKSATWHEGESVPLESVYNRSGCHGSNLSPELDWTGAPSNARSFAITILDLDAPKPGGWSHWVMFNIPGDLSKLEAGAGTDGSGRAPIGALECVNDYGTRGYGGPCPPPGAAHRYVVSLYALKVEKLPANLDAAPAKAVKQIEANALAVARMTVKYQQ